MYPALGSSFAIILFFGSLFSQQSSSIYPTQTAQRDPQAMTVLAQALNTAGGTSAITAIQDYTASGTITYYWAGQPVQGAVTIRGRGSDATRLDAVLPSGTRSFAVDEGVASIKEIGKETAPVSFDAAVNFNS
jgi:hypothetical protein